MQVWQKFIPARRFLSVALAGLAIGVAAPALADDDEALIILTSASQQARGMAMVLGNAMQDQGARIHVLLCDSAGDMALTDHSSEPLAPRNVTPEQLLGRLMGNGARVEVCTLYLPNSEHAQSDLREGVGVAQPPAIAERMMDDDVRVFAF